MQKKEILQWLWEVARHKDSFETLPDYKRYHDGPKKGQIIVEAED